MKNKNSKEILQKLGLSYYELINATTKSGINEMPDLYCNITVYPNYIALDQHPCDFHKTQFTAISWFEYDEKFYGIHGLANAIRHNSIKLLNQYKERYRGVRIAIQPDISLVGNCYPGDNLIRIIDSRLIALWLTQNLGICVIPLVSFPTLEWLPFILDGYRNCSVVAFSTKGFVDSREEREILVKAIQETVDTLNLRTIIVYDVCQDEGSVKEIFSYAIAKGIEIRIPANMLKSRNQVLGAKRKKERIQESSFDLFPIGSIGCDEQGYIKSDFEHEIKSIENLDEQSK